MSLIPCEEIVRGKRCGKTPTQIVEAAVSQGIHGARKRVFHLCADHLDRTYEGGCPRVIDDWLLGQRREKGDRLFENKKTGQQVISAKNGMMPCSSDWVQIPWWKRR